MNRDLALEELKLRLCNKNVLFRSLIVETIMEDLARQFNADPQIWGLTGLLHDIDYEKTVNQPQLHGITGAEILENLGFDEAIVYSVRAHNDINGIPRKRKMDKALYLADYTVKYIIDTYTDENLKLSEVQAEKVLESLADNSLFFNNLDELRLNGLEFLEVVLKASRKILYMG